MAMANEALKLEQLRVAFFAVKARRSGVGRSAEGIIENVVGRHGGQFGFRNGAYCMTCGYLTVTCTAGWEPLLERWLAKAQAKLGIDQ